MNFSSLDKLYDALNDAHYVGSHQDPRVFEWLILWETVGLYIAGCSSKVRSERDHAMKYRSIMMRRLQAN